MEGNTFINYLCYKPCIADQKNQRFHYYTVLLVAKKVTTLISKIV